MLARTMKAVFLVMAAGTVSMTSLALPAARAMVSVLPVSQSGSLSPSQLRTLIERSHAGFGDIAADVACTYLKKLRVHEEREQGRIKTAAVERDSEEETVAAEN
jgi:hypothetical protein